MKSSSQIQKDVYEELKWDPSITQADIGVSVKEGVVTISGSVLKYAEKFAAEAAAKRVGGVTAVVDEIKVKIPGALAKDDQDIAKAVMTALEWHVWVPHKDIKVVVENGWVTVSGSASWEYERNSVEKAIRYLDGVKGVTNNIILRPAVSSKDVKEKIEKAILRTAKEDIDRINVSTTDGQVRLTGRVSNWTERSNAESAAWSAPGVSKVKNEIRIQSNL